MLAWFSALAVVAMGLIIVSDASAASSGGIDTGGTGSTGVTQGDTREGSETRNERVGLKFERLWDRFPVGDRRWARTTSQCESGGDPDAIGGGGVYRGAFQFMRSTWKASPKSPGGDPIAFPYRTQAVVAVLLMHRDGRGHWPVCG
ncbi:MAG: transglycosylase family protein [Solirubrobacterales bacterium]